ncbi:MAG: DNA topoisomerase 3 [Spirochaetes bacterium]|nr:DNA topoisomerase 3 [Spirochaetota bacterium]
MKLCIAEKPSVAREIASVIGAKVRKDGYIEGNGYAVTWTYGHLCTLKTPDEYTPAWKKWSMAALPMFPDRYETVLIKAKGISQQFKVIKSLVKSCDEVINCGDAGIEGELIQRWVLNMAGCKKPLKRLWISSLTEEAIREGFENLKPGEKYNSLYNAGEARAIGDWLLGMNASRLYTLKFSGGQGVLSIGRVQTPTLALIVKRQQEIENFKPEPYWLLQTVYRNVTFNSSYRKITEKEKGEQLLDEIRDSDFTVDEIEKKKEKEYAPYLFDLTSLQVECNRKFGMSADSTLKIAQKLYERKVLTYPRVDTRFLPDDMFVKIKGILKNLSSHHEAVNEILQKDIKKSKRTFDDSKVTDHHAIIPTGSRIANDSSPEWKVYDLVTKAFIAQFCDDCHVENTTVKGHVKTVKFTAKGKIILKEGWRVLYPKDENSKKKSDEDEEQILPEFIQGESGPHAPELLQKETTPPKPYTEATLLRAMETAGKQVDDEDLRQLMKDNGIGRPSTRANIIETLFRRKYIVRSKKSLLPTETGIGLIGVIQNELLTSVELTGMWERKLRKIERGEFTKENFMTEMTDLVTSIVGEVRSSDAGPIKMMARKKTASKQAFSKSSISKKVSRRSVKKDAPSAVESQAVKKAAAPEKSPVGMNCPVCGEGKLIKGNTAWGCSRFRSGCKFVLPFEHHGKKLTGIQALTLVKKMTNVKISGFNNRKNKAEGILTMTDEKIGSKNDAHENKEIKSDKAKSGMVCPKCGKGNIIKGRQAWGCSGYAQGCNFVIPFEKIIAVFGDDMLDQMRLSRLQKSSLQE